MKPNKVNGLTDAERTRRCEGKQRWCDELTATAGAIHAVERYRKADKLWTYRCPHCKGWHLTHKPQTGRDPAAVSSPLEVVA